MKHRLMADVYHCDPITFRKIPHSDVAIDWTIYEALSRKARSDSPKK